MKKIFSYFIIGFCIMTTVHTQPYPTGFFISVEGIDGAGKTTFIKELTKLFNHPENVLITKEPGGSQLGKIIREMIIKIKTPRCPLAEYFLFAADRAQHMIETIIPQLKAHGIVITDRSGDSSVVYQGHAQGVDIEKIKTTNAWAMQGITPHVTFYIKLDVHTATQRIITRDGSLNPFEQKIAQLNQKLYDGFTSLYEHAPHVCTLDGTQSPQTLAKQAYKHLMQYDYFTS